MVPRKDFSLASVRTMFSTGSPLAPESFDYVYQCVKDDILLVVDLRRHRHRVVLRARRAHASGLSRRDAGPRPRHGRRRLRREGPADRAAQQGELVCKSPFPSMPVGFWNDPDGAKYHAAYFERFPGHLVPRRLGRDHRARRPDHLRPLRRDAQSRRRAHRHRGDLSPGGAAARGGREPRDRPGLAARRSRRRARRAVRQARGRASCSTTRSPTASSARSARTRRRGTCRPRSCRSTDIPRTKSGKIVELAVRNVVHGREVTQRRSARQSRGARAVPRSRGAQELAR